MMTERAVEERFVACNAAIKTLIEVLIGEEVAKPAAIARLLRGQAAEMEENGWNISSILLNGFAEFAEDPNRIAGRRLLNEPPQGSA